MTFLLILMLTTVIRIRLLDMPLERDEGEFAYMGQLLLDGVSPYQEVYTMKWPGTHAAYAVIMAVFGETARGIHAGLILITTATTLLVFVLGRRLGGERLGAVAAGTYALLCTSPPSDGLAAHASHFVVLPALAGLLLLQKPGVNPSRSRVFFAGLLLGLGALMKQPGVMFGAFAAIWLARDEFVRARPALASSGGPAWLPGAGRIAAVLCTLFRHDPYRHVRSLLVLDGDVCPGLWLHLHAVRRNGPFPGHRSQALQAGCGVVESGGPGFGAGVR